MFSKLAGSFIASQCTLEDIVCVRYIFPDKNDFKTYWPVLRKYLVTGKPAATMIEAGLADDLMKIEIEVTAVLPTS